MLLDQEAVHQLQVAAFLLVWSLAMYGWTRWRPTARAGVLHDGARITAFGVVCYLLASAQASVGVSDLSQTLVYNIRALPFLVALAYIGRVLAANQAKKTPALERLCRSAPYVLGCVWLGTVTIGLLAPVPALERPYPMPQEFVLLKLRNLAEFVFFAVSAIVFGKEMLRRRVVPSPAVRLQHTTLCLGSLAFSVLVLNSFASALAETRSLPAFLDQALAQAHRPVQMGALLVGGLAYTAGLFLYESGQENTRIVAHLRKWIRHRHDLELGFDAAGNKVGNALTEAYFRKAAHDDTLRIDAPGEDSAAYVVKLLGHIHRRGDARAPEIAALARLQSDLSRATDVASRLFVKVEGNVHYDIRHDSLYAATAPALILAEKKARTALLGQPDWVQLAAVAAADAGLLPEPKARLILDPASSCVRRTVLEAYTLAKLTEEEL